jgi:hypothetical protein
MVTSNDVVAINTAVSLTTKFTDNNVINALIDWHDNTPLQNVALPKSTFTASHVYKNSGFYSVTLILTDACGAIAMSVYEAIAVYDNQAKRASFKGNGWYYSMPGAYVLNSSAEGKAEFSFDAQYTKNASVPRGSAEFNFKVGKMKFSSTEYKWLVMDDNSGILKGVGKLNGGSNHEILISARNGTIIKKNKLKKADYIRVKIWDPSGVVIYDTQLGQPDFAEATTKLGGGSIKIDNGSSTPDTYNLENGVDGENAENLVQQTETTTTVYPNPFQESITLKFASASLEHLNLQLLDITGKVIYQQDMAFREDGLYSFKLSDKQKDAGLYILKVKQGRRVEFLRLTRK